MGTASDELTDGLQSRRGTEEDSGAISGPGGAMREMGRGTLIISEVPRPPIRGISSDIPIRLENSRARTHNSYGLYYKAYQKAEDRQLFHPRVFRSHVMIWLSHLGPAKN